jgi:hypothetical protein
LIEGFQTLWKEAFKHSGRRLSNTLEGGFQTLWKEAFKHSERRLSNTLEGGFQTLWKEDSHLSSSPSTRTPQSLRFIGDGGTGKAGGKMGTGGGRGCTTKFPFYFID